MYTLYTAPDCGSFVAHALMDEAGADYRLVEIDIAKREHKSKAYWKSTLWARFRRSTWAGAGS
jgi:glutathione S-transferase